MSRRSRANAAPRRRRSGPGKAKSLGRSPRDAPANRWKRVMAIVGGVGVVAALLGTMASLFDWGSAHLRTAHAPAPALVRATILEVRRSSSREPLSDFLRLTRQSSSRYDAALVSQSGYMFEVRIRISGYVGERLPLVWQMYERPADVPVGGDVYRQLVGRLVPHGRTHESESPAWVPYPPHRGRYFVRFTLFDPRNQPVDQRDSATFRFA